MYPAPYALISDNLLSNPKHPPFSLSFLNNSKTLSHNFLVLELAGVKKEESPKYGV
jgi:hypothetical protein